jgi:hypothetical protein
MTVPPKWRERRDAIKAAMPEVTRPGYDDERAEFSPESDPAERHRMSYQVARNTSIPAEHLAGLSKIAADSEDVSVSNAGHYDPYAREIHLQGSMSSAGLRATPKTRLASRLDTLGTLTHEMGHHQHNMLNPVQFEWARPGLNEAVAENYADRYTNSPRDSVYDQHVYMSNYSTQQYLGGAPGVQDYRSYRGAGKMPGEVASDDEMFGTAPDYIPAASKFNDRMRGK